MEQYTIQVPINYSKFIPWAPTSSPQVYLSDLTVNDKLISTMTFTEVAVLHSSITVGISNSIVMAKAKDTNKFIGIAGPSATPSKVPVRPDLADIELALLHAMKGILPSDYIASTMNMTKERVSYITRATEHLYHSRNTELPKLPLVTITDTSNYYSDDMLMEDYSITRDTIDHYTEDYKELLRRLEQEASKLKLCPNAPIRLNKSSEEEIQIRTSIPSTFLEEVSEDYSDLCSKVWDAVSREEGVSGLLSIKDWARNKPIDNIRLTYTSMVKLKCKQTKLKGALRHSKCVNGKRAVRLKHSYGEGSYNAPLSIPSKILQLAIDIYNMYVTLGPTTKQSPPAFERIIIGLLISPSSFIASKLDEKLSIKPLSYYRGHCMPIRNYTINTPPLVLPQFPLSTLNTRYSYGVLCKHCSTFISKHTTSSCAHISAIDIFMFRPKYTYLPIYIYTPLDTSALSYSLHYYELTPQGSISRVLPLDLLRFSSNISIPLHRKPFMP